MAVEASGSRRPEPLVDKGVDLRDFPFMPVDIVRLFGSEFHSQSDDAAWRAGVTLWLKSYHQVPASSIPNDDVALTRLAELGRDTKTWRKIKEQALRGWVLCDDGRLYHPVVAEKALEGWIEKLTFQKTSEAGHAKRYGKAFDAGPIDEALRAAVARLSALNPQSRALKRRALKAAVGSDDEPEDLADGRKKQPKNLPRDKEGKEKDLSSLRSDGACRASDDDFAKFIRACPKPVSQDAARRKLDEVLASGVPFEVILAGMNRYAVAERGNDLRFLDAPDRWLEKGRWKDGIVPGNSPNIPADKMSVSRSDSRWPELAERYKQNRKMYPPSNAEAWLFPIAWVEATGQAA